MEYTHRHGGISAVENMNYIRLTRFDIANGPGIRDVLWVSGCNHGCSNCHNLETWNPYAGSLFTDEILTQILSDLSEPFRHGITFSGGDPLYPDNRETISSIIHEIRQQFPSKSIWVYTGYLFEEIENLALLNGVDVLVDGPFIESLKDISLVYRGSSNQRVIDVPLTLSSGKVHIFKAD